MRTSKSISILLILVSLFLGGSCSRSHNIEDEQYLAIEEVINGNTVRLEDGVTVHLLGVSPNSSMTKAHLTGLIGKTISLLPDSEGDQTFPDLDSEIWAYAMIDESGKPLNRELLMVGGRNALNTAFVNDSLVAFQNIVKRERHELTATQLGELLDGASFIIWGQDGNGRQFNGTGFFISNDGLAISCSHVVNYGSSYVVQLSDPKGQIIDKQYNIKRPLYCGNPNGMEDYAIFYVDLDDNAKRMIAPLTVASQTPDSGADIATVGNPGVYGQVLPMSFARGYLANVRPERGRIQADINVGPGFSGGAVVDKYGEVVGINQSILVDPNLNSKYVFLTDMQMVRAKLDELNEAYNGK